MKDIEEKLTADATEDEMDANPLLDEVLDEVAGGCCPRKPVEHDQFRAMPRKSIAEYRRGSK